MPIEPHTVGIHRLLPSRAVALTEAWDAAHTFLPAVRRAELRLLPESPGSPTGGGEVAVEWTVPGLRIPHGLQAGPYRRTWLETVPLVLGELEATMHGSPVGNHTAGHLSVYRRGLSALFRAYEPSLVDAPAEQQQAAEAPPLTIGVVTAPDPDGIVVTEHGVWHTLLPQWLSLVAFGTNLGVYLAHLPPPGTSLSPEECREAAAHYWIGVVSVLSARSAQYCRCGRGIGAHKPSWATIRAAAAASGRPLPPAPGAARGHALAQPPRIAP